ncbi:MAG: hypothetical protein IPJ81_16210 [Chitinophagaceae bacterium]|nr:hypothetical protein [Chitinophagaceae bacterium]
MNLKNYTSEVPAITSMGRIEKNLVQAGATDISKNYKEGICVAIRFRMMVNNNPLFFQLPARVDACFKVLWNEIKRPVSGTETRIRQQAERTAWKIISDWVEVQISMITLEQAELLQVFLPYAYNPAKDQTFFEQLKEGGFKALPGIN